MLRVLHLLDSHSDFQTCRGVEDLRDLGEGFAADVRTIGRGGDWRSIPSAVVSLRRARGRDLVHAWGLRAMMAAAAGARQPLAFTVPAGPTAQPLRWLRAVMQYRNVQVIPPTATAHKALLTGGIPPQQLHLIRPGADFARIRRRDPKLRSDLGFAPDDYVLLLAGESNRGADHRDGLWAAGIVHVLDPQFKLLLWGRGREIGRLKEFDRRLRNRLLLCIAEERLGRRLEYEELLPCADMVLAAAAGPSAVLPVAIAMAAGLPIVAAANATLAELLEDHHNALLAPGHSPRIMAQKILQFRQDAAMRRRLSDTARTDAYDYFSVSRFRQQHREFYRQMHSGRRLELAVSGAACRDV